MKITINGEIKELESEVNLNRLLELFSLPSQRIAVELNREIIRREEYSSYALRDGDILEIVRMVGGGAFEG